MINDLREVLPTAVQKSYFMLSAVERAILDAALEKYRPGQSEPILVQGTVSRHTNTGRIDTGNQFWLTPFSSPSSAQ
jgi:hypothetical protein